MKRFSLPLLCSGFFLLSLGSSASSFEHDLLPSFSSIEDEQDNLEILNHVAAYSQDNPSHLIFLSMLLGGGLGLVKNSASKAPKFVSFDSQQNNNSVPKSENHLERHLAQADLNLFLENALPLAPSGMPEITAPEYIG